MSLASTVYYSLLQIRSHNNNLKALRILVEREKKNNPQFNIIKPTISQPIWLGSLPHLVHICRTWVLLNTHWEMLGQIVLALFIFDL